MSPTQFAFNRMRYGFEDQTLTVAPKHMHMHPLTEAGPWNYKSVEMNPPRLLSMCVVSTSLYTPVIF